jgi:hypothetical protein
MIKQLYEPPVAASHPKLALEFHISSAAGAKIVPLLAHKVLIFHN